MKGIHYRIIYLFLLVALISCSSKQIKNELDGVWTVFRIRINGDSCVYYRNFTSYSMLISEKGNIDFPAYHSNEQVNIRDGHGQWELVLNEGKTFFQIYSEDSVFSGLFRMRFLYNPQNEKLFLELTSDGKYILASRNSINDIEILNPARQNSKENRAQAVVRLSGGEYVNYVTAPFDSCLDYIDQKMIIYM